MVNKIGLEFFAFLSYFVLVFVFLKIFEQNNFGTFFILLKILSIVIVAAILLFNENLTWKNILGIIFDIFAIVLLTY